MTAFTERRRGRLVLDLLLGNRELVARLASESDHVVVAQTPAELAAGMNRLGLGHTVDAEVLEAELDEYDARIRRGRPFFNDDQLRRIADFRAYRGDRLRTCAFQQILDPGARPLIAICLHVLSRKSLGGIMTDLECRVLGAGDAPIQGLYAVGESAGFGGGGIHGLRSLEGTFLGSCVLTGRLAGAAIAGARI
jgi:predicted oxidoreductase